MLLLFSMSAEASSCYSEVYRFDLLGDMPEVNSQVNEMSIDFSPSVKFLSAPFRRTLATPLTALKGSWGMRYVWRLANNTVFLIKKDVTPFILESCKNGLASLSNSFNSAISLK